MAIEMMNLQGHQMVRAGNLWVSRAPFTNLDWQANADRLRTDHRKYGVLTEMRVGGEVRHSLHYISTLATLKDTFGEKRVGQDFGGSAVVCNDDFTVAAFEFFALEKIGMDRLRHPVTDVTQFHAQGMCLAIGADLMTDDQYITVVSGPEGDRKHATPNGDLFGPNGEEYVHSSLKTQKEGTADVEDPSRPDGPYGTRDYTGNVWKWMKRNLKEGHQFGFRGGSWSYDVPELFAVSYRGINHPDDHYGGVGFLSAAPAQDSR